MRAIGCSDTYVRNPVYFTCMGLLVPDFDYIYKFLATCVVNNIKTEP